MDKRFFPKVILPALCGLAVALARASEPEAAPPIDPKAASHSLGLMFGSQLRNGGVGESIDFAQLERGIRDGLSGTVPSDADKNQMARMLKSGRASMIESNRTKAREFLATNKAAAGVVTTESGLQYTVLKAGDAATALPKPTDRVIVDFRGRLLDGTQIDSSMSHGGHASINLNGGALKGFREALLLMRPGAQWRVFLPPELAYDASPPPGIPPGALLVYDLTLVGIEGPKTLDSKNAAGGENPPK